MTTRANKTSRFVDSMNGVVVAYAVGLINSLLAVLISFGLNISTTQQASVVTFANAAMVLLAHLAHQQAQRNPSPASVASAVERGVLSEADAHPAPSPPTMDEPPQG